MVRINPELLAHTAKKGSDRFKTRANTIVRLYKMGSKLGGSYINTHGTSYTVAAPSIGDLNKPGCKTSRVPAEQMAYYYKLVPKKRQQRGSAHNLPAGGDTNTGNTNTGNTNTGNTNTGNTNTGNTNTGNTTPSPPPAGVCSSWSEWTQCYLSEDSQKHRKRSCDNPPGVTGTPTCSDCNPLEQDVACEDVKIRCAENGAVQSHIDGDTYDANVDQTFEIRPLQQHSIIELNFTSFEVENGANCEFDSVTVKDHVTGKVLLGPLCGGGLRSLSTTSNAIDVIFQTDDNVEDSGWSLEWCAPQVIVSDNYPSAYDNDASVTRKISVPSGTIKFVVEDLDIEYAPSCEYDWLRIYEVLSDNSVNEILSKTCGKNAKSDDLKNLVSQTSIAYVEFMSDDFGCGTGFKLAWAQVPPVEA